jgi:DNA repair protein RecO (recombination protein O)
VSLIADIAIVLRRLDYSETSQVLVLLTREVGQERVIAKGVKRSTKTKPSIGIDLLEMGNVTFSRRPGKEDVLATLTEWRQLDTFPGIRRDLIRLYAAQYAAEVTSQLTELHDPHPALFDALQGLLAILAGEPTAPEGEKPVVALCRYLWRLFMEIGLRPELSRCMNCSRPIEADKVVYFSSRAGGAICRDCESATVEKRRIAADSLAWLSADCAGEAPKIGSVFDILDYHLGHTMGRPARLSDPLRELMKPHPVKH